MYQIEHVLPQSIEGIPEWQEMLGPNWREVHERLCNTLGNLTLTGYNQEYSNSPFKVKLGLKPGGLKVTHLHLNEEIANHTKWDEAAIEGRANALAAEALVVWPYPRMETDVIDKYRPKKERKPDSGWDLASTHPSFMPGGECHELFGLLCTALEEECPTWEQYVAKYYVGYRTGGKRLRVAIKERTSTGTLAVALPRSVDELSDPEGRAQDKRATKGFGPGCPTRVDVRKKEDVRPVMELIKQC